MSDVLSAAAKNPVRPAHGAEGAKSKGIRGVLSCFDFAELRSATLNTNGFGILR